MAFSAWARSLQPLQINRWLINASKKYVSLVPGGSYMHHADSFALIRGGHLDLSRARRFPGRRRRRFRQLVEVQKTDMPSVGGAMDLAVGAKSVWLLMDHTTKDGESTADAPNLQLSAHRRRRRQTGLHQSCHVLDVTGDAFAVREIVPGRTFEALQDVTDAPLKAGEW